jgi:hypothetical protein
MRLFEVADPEDARSILAVVQGLANKRHLPSKLPFNTFKNYINGDEIGIGTPAALVAFKNAVDPEGDVIADVDDHTGTVTLNTNVKDPKDQQQTTSKSTGPSVDQMAKSNSDLSPKI